MLFFIAIMSGLTKEGLTIFTFSEVAVLFVLKRLSLSMYGGGTLLSAEIFADSFKNGSFLGVIILKVSF